MTKFKVFATYSVDIFTEIKAKNEQEANNKAHELLNEIDEWTEVNSVYDSCITKIKKGE
tara:strand:- start:7 stop:183 length:177 start_codon:yes stop_codon:yes gene_type:complete